MKINKARTKRKFLHLLLILMVAVIIYVGYVAYFKPADNTSNSDTNYSAPTQSQVSAGEQTKVNTVENNKASSNSAKTNTTSPASKTPFSTNITTHEVNNGVLQIRNVINGVYSSGSCTLTLSKNGQTVTKTVDIQPLPQSSTCKGFNIPTTELSRGTWQAVLKVTISGKSTESTVSINI